MLAKKQNLRECSADPKDQELNNFPVWMSFRGGTTRNPPNDCLPMTVEGDFFAFGYEAWFKNQRS
jgi:hypothetical protein